MSASTAPPRRIAIDEERETGSPRAVRTKVRPPSEIERVAPLEGGSFVANSSVSPILTRARTSVGSRENAFAIISRLNHALTNATGAPASCVGA